MAEESQRQRQYEYNNNSNLVLQAERDHRRHKNESTGEVESLVGKVNFKMGDLAQRGEAEGKKRKLEEKVGRSKKSKVDYDGGYYQPKTEQSLSAYNGIMSIVSRALGSQPMEILNGGCEEVLSILKNEQYLDPEKHAEVVKLLSGVDLKVYGELVMYANRIHDFVSEESLLENGEEKTDHEEMDTEMGVAVVFDQEDEEEIEESSEEEIEEEMVVEEEKRIRGMSDDEKEEEGVDDLVVEVNELDAFWLQRELSRFYSDANVSAKMNDEVMEIMKDGKDVRSVEQKLVLLLDFDKFEFIKKLIRNRYRIYFCTKLQQAENEDEKNAVEKEMMKSTEGMEILTLLKTKSTADSWMQDRMGKIQNTSKMEARKLKKMVKSNKSSKQDVEDNPVLVEQTNQLKPSVDRILDIDSYSFAQGGHFMSNKDCHLPQGTWRAQKKGYEEVHVPAVKAKSTGKEKLIQIQQLPSWTHAAFNGMTSLNRVQSKMYETAFKSAENVLLCAPTGAGKTNVAVLTVLHELAKARLEDGSFDLNSFKIVYIAPMKALVQEVVANFSQRLTQPYGIQVRELSGDQNLSREQIYSTQIIVTTPEKWDIITRKSGDRTYTQLVKLIIIDEIHLLHDDRGPVLESIVARTIRQIEATQEMVRLVGLSATLPNYEDVATFMRVDPSKGLFFFDSTFRPVPLQQQYIGIMEKKAIKRFQLMNEICYEKVIEQAGKNQVLIFVHSRKETATTARALRDICLEKDEMSKFIKENSATSEILQTETANVKNPDLKELLSFGFGIHHAGMPRADRNLVEELFADGHLQVLCSTATLAWGVNLPAHTVIIKGTQMYNAEKGAFAELSPLDIMQMLGRAGRVQYDTQGEGIIITQHSELKFYLSLMNQQLPVESQMMKKLADALNAEIVLGTIQNLQQAANWLGYTYLYVRMLRSPTTYGISYDEIEKDKTLQQRRLDLVHAAATTLSKHGLIKYDRRSGVFQVTALGRVASHFYVVHHSMSIYNEHLKPVMSDIEIFRLFSLSHEFRHVVVRSEEKLEMAKLLERVPIPVKESMEEPSAKINVLLQAYISHLQLNGFALVADMVHVFQSASRILRALFEIAFSRGWASLADKVLNVCKMVDRRMWLSQSPLRQFPNALPSSLLRKIEKKDIPFARYFDLSVADLGQLINQPGSAKQLYRAIHQFPKLELGAHIQPITRSMLKVELTITPDFEFKEEVHGNVVAFWIIVEDVDGENVLHREWFMLKRRYAADEHLVTFTIPIFDPTPPLYYIRVVSDRWLHCEFSLPVSFNHLILPAKNHLHTELLDLQPLPTTAVKDKMFNKFLNTSFKYFNPIQTQVFSKLYEGDGNVFVAAPTGSGKTVCAELALVRCFSSHPNAKCVYIAPRQDLCDHRYTEWSAKFADLHKEVVMLVGDTALDLKLIAKGDIIVSTPEKWDVLSRRWRQRKVIQQIKLFIADELQLLGSGVGGSTLEVVVSRMRYISSQLENAEAKNKGNSSMIRLLGLSASVANGKDIGDWIGASNDSVFSFHPNVRPVPLELHVFGFDINHFSSRMLAMSKPAYNSIRLHSPNDPVVVFVPSRKQCRLTAIDLVTYALADDSSKQFLNMDESAMEKQLASWQAQPTIGKGSGGIDDGVVHIMMSGVGFCHEAMNNDTRSEILDCFRRGEIRVLVVTHSMCWNLGDISSRMALLLGTQYYDGREHRYVDYPVASIQQMIGIASRPLVDSSNQCVILCHSPRKDFFKKFLYEPLPVESHLDHFIADHVNAEIVTKTIESKQDAVDYLTWTYLYRRLIKNPNYYNIQGNSHQHLSDFLSELVESTITNLEESRCIQIDEDDVSVSPLNLGMISAYYSIQYTTIELFACSLTAKTKLKSLLEILSSSTEFGQLPIRYKEEQLLQRTAKHLKVPILTKFNDPHTKANVMLQSHFSRSTLPMELRKDQTHVLLDAVRLLQAIVDVLSSNGWLKPALAAMDLCQMVVQGLWHSDSSLMQIPFFTSEIVDRLKAHSDSSKNDDEIDSPLDILSLEDEDREKLLQLPDNKMSVVAKFCNAYPDINIDYSVNDPDELYTGESVEVQVTLQREVDEDDAVDELGVVHAPLYPKIKTENWWLVVGDPTNNTLHSIKRVTLKKEATTVLEFTAPDKVGDYKYQLYLICDSYMGCDLENEITFNVKQGEDVDSD